MKSNSDQYKTVASPASGEYREKGSKFIAYISAVESESDFKDFLGNIKKEHNQARHHCFAFRLSPESEFYRSSDDREPSGTAGKPILGVIRANELYQTAIIVVRYFGGTLLGVPGLIRSYKSAAESALENSEIIEKIPEVKFKICFEYQDTSEIMRYLDQFSARIEGQHFDRHCEICVALDRSKAEALLTILKEKHIFSERIKIIPL